MISAKGAKTSKWLCPWGVECIDESHREPVRTLPDRAQHLCIATGYEYFDVDVLSGGDVKEAIDNKGHQFERVLLHYLDDLSCLENLHKHPCEELHMISCGALTEADVENIVRCESLCVIRTELTEIPEGLLRELATLPKLEIFEYDFEQTMEEQIKMLQLFPHGHFFNISANITKKEDVSDIEGIIKARKNVIRHAQFEIPPTYDWLVALISCTNLQSLSIKDLRVDIQNLGIFFSNLRVKQTLRYVDVSWSCVTKPIFNHLATFTNLRWIDVSNTDIEETDVVKILRSNALHIRYCYIQSTSINVSEALLHAIENCYFLEVLDARFSQIENKGLLHSYKKSGRRNHQAIFLEEEDVPALSAALNGHYSHS